MSETKTVDSKEKRTSYSVEVEPMEFEADFSGKITTSLELCKLTNEYFHAAFADYEGCTFEMTQGWPTISLYFNHGKTTDGAHYACAKSSTKTVGNSLLDKTRGRDAQLREGDRYAITDDGVDVIKPLLSARFFNQGNPDWKRIVTDIQDNGMNSYYQPQAARQLTKIVGIDPRNICRLIYGEKEGDNYIDYGIEVKGDLTIKGGFGNQNPNYALAITKAYSGNLVKTYEKLGINAVGSGIIR